MPPTNNSDPNSAEEILARRINAINRSVRTQNPSNSGAYIRGFDAWMTDSNSVPEQDEGSLPDIKAVPMTPEAEAALYKAMERIEANQRDRRSERIQHPGRKEIQYSSMIEREKMESMSVAEILQSEVPICAASIPARKLGEMSTITKHLFMSGDNRSEPVRLACEQCHVQVSLEYMFFCLDHIYCATHLPDLNFCCVGQHMTADCKQYRGFDDRDFMVCANCVKRHSECHLCGKSLTTEFLEVQTCSECITRGDTNQPTRGFSLSTKWVGKELGDVVKSKRMFSCEIEAVTPHREWGFLLCQTLPGEVGVTTDGSITAESRKYGFEVQSPRLAGKKGEELVARLTTGLKKIDSSVNDSCGLHIHLDGKGILLPDRKAYPAQLIQLLKSYVVFEDVIMSFLPHGRRRNDFCRPLAEVLRLVDIELLDSVLDVEKMWYKQRTFGMIAEAKREHYHASRYFGANFGSLLNEGHFEVRFHSGTLNPKKILEWANLHALIMDSCSRLSFTPEFLRSAQQVSRLSEKTNILFDAIGLAEASRQYFRARQKKFGNKNTVDEEVTVAPSRAGRITSADIDLATQMINVQTRGSTTIEWVDVPQDHPHIHPNSITGISGI